MTSNPVTGEAEITMGDARHRFRFTLRAGMRLEDLLEQGKTAYALSNAVVTACRLAAGYQTANPGAEFGIEDALDLMDTLPPDALVALDEFGTDCLHFFYLAPMERVGAYWKKIHDAPGNDSPEPASAS